MLNIKFKRYLFICQSQMNNWQINKSLLNFDICNDKTQNTFPLILFVIIMDLYISIFTSFWKAFKLNPLDTKYRLNC